MEQWCRLRPSVIESAAHPANKTCLSVKYGEGRTPFRTGSEIQWWHFFKNHRQLRATAAISPPPPRGWDWIERCFTSLPTQYRLYGRRFYRSRDPTNSIKVLKEQIVHRQIKHTINRYEHKTQQVPYGVTRGRLPQRAGLPGLNGGGAAAAVPPSPGRG